ncbi:polyribonucleotide nucleotidyltransferase [Patescibacteria group bacterium]|nr:polyribonucleotide nucleotidyltransferase [Patescibacteria group bacterium]
MLKIFKTEIEGKELSVELGRLALQANSSALVKYGETAVLATAVMSKRTTDKPYFPLTVDYEEKFYAAGKIKGSRWIKREGRPSDEAILTGRLVDRTIRSLFDQRIRNDIQVVLTVLSFDGENDPALPALIGASIALSTSDIPWNGPVAGIYIGQDNDKWILTPTMSAKEKSGSEIIIVGTEKNKEIIVNMLEGHMPEMTEDDLAKGIEFSKKYIKNLLDFQKKIIDELKPEKAKVEIKELDKELEKKIQDILDKELEDTLYSPKTKKQGKQELDELIEKIKEICEEDQVGLAIDFMESQIDKMVHKNVLEKEKRLDGRKIDEFRKITADAGILPRIHGSGLFKRGETQVLSLLTLGPPGAEQMFDQMEFEGTKRFMHDYNFPPFSVGETGRMFGPGRREIGHGALAEKALKPIIPSKDEFPYTIRIVSEVLGSNGSSSMASVCGSTLSLLDAGVPIKANVSGIAMGLIMDDKKYKILTDIQGYEDHYGDMDLKVAGTRKGITAIQMDVKIDGISLDILKDAFKQAKKARLGILDEMEKTIKTHRSELSSFAPRVYSLKINPSKIGLVIGPGGKTIHEITDETGAAIDIDDDGTVFITGDDADLAKKAMSRIKALTREFKVGEIFDGKVIKIMDFGAFVEIAPKQEGLLHISEMGKARVEKVEDVVSQGDIVNVKIKKVEDNGKISLTMVNKK